jgi:hypothetical protein
LNNIDISFFEKIIYSDSKSNKINEIKKIENPEYLHIIAFHYNWDDGFEIPYAIIENKYCDFGTALMIFYLAEGNILLNLELENNLNIYSNKTWKDFLKYLYKKIINNDFINKNILYDPKLSKVELFKIKKKNPNILNIFFDQTPGKEINIPKILQVFN